MTMPHAIIGETVGLETEVSDVKMGPIEGNSETFTFKLRGAPYKANQTGRLRNLCIGHSESADARIAVMALVDGVATPL